MLVKEKNILVIPSSDTSSPKILIAQKNTLIISDLETEKNTSNIIVNKEKTFTLLFPDEILSIHFLSSLHKILISCVNNKNLYLFDDNVIYDNKKLSEFNIEKNALVFQGNKKITSIIDIEESKDKYFLLISDKFGEISIKPIKKDETQENFAKEIKIASGHCDTIVFFQKSKNDKLLLSSDSFGKIKIYNFPNIFNVISVLLYHEDEIKYVNFGGELDKFIIVLNKANSIDIWSTYDFVIQNKFKLDFIENDEYIVDVRMVNKNNNIVLLTNKKVILLAMDDNKYVIEKTKEINIKDLIKEEKMEKFDSKFFDYEGKVYHLCVNNEDNKNIIINSIL